MGNPLQTLLNNIENVYLPTLQHQRFADKLDNNIKRLLTDLRAGLDNSLAMGNITGSGKILEEDNCAGILEPCDEFEFWQTASSQGMGSLQERARFYTDRFSSIWKFYKDMSSIDISGLKEVIDQTWEVLD
mmetsp:Transcript_20390/g.17699  ORF Transcript_20390/g.17699 Transcript_20390/m.17699 type:complete len:131 (+) Transcript_20390:42-434(+)